MVFVAKRKGFLRRNCFVYMGAMDIQKTYQHKPPADITPESMVILLHGLGSNGQDLISLAPLWAQNLPKTVFVSPDAPFPCDMAPGMLNSYQWFSLQERTEEKMLSGIEKAFPVVENFIKAQLEEYKLPAAKCVLAGFSQGTMMSLYTAPRYKDKLAGVLGYSGAFLGGDEIIKKPDGFQNLPIHLIHGDADDVVPVQAYHMATETLRQAGFQITGNVTPGLTHGIDEAGVESGAAFLAKVLG